MWNAVLLRRGAGPEFGERGIVEGILNGVMDLAGPLVTTCAWTRMAVVARDGGAERKAGVGKRPSATNSPVRGSQILEKEDITGGGEDESRSRRVCLQVKLPRIPRSEMRIPGGREPGLGTMTVARTIWMGTTLWKFGIAKVFE